MGGDAGVGMTLPACEAFLASHPNASLLLVGSAAVVNPAAQRLARCTAVVSTEIVAMDDSVEVALRRKKDSSMRQAVAAVKDGRAHAAVSAGNTGALMAISRYLLKTIDGIDRPAIASQLPNAKGGATTVLDLGANVDCGPAHLLQFALMGSALVQALRLSGNPSVGLLNIGEEVIKGNDTIKQAGEWLREAAAAKAINFYGNVEGNDIFKGTVDVVVCDGFVGNVALKASEGVAQMIGGFLREALSRNAYTKAAAFLAMPALKAFKNRVDHRRYNGAALLGLRGLVFKSHGSADAYGFAQALARAHDAAANGLTAQVQSRVEQAASVFELHRTAVPPPGPSVAVAL